MRNQGVRAIARLWKLGLGTGIVLVGMNAPRLGAQRSAPITVGGPAFEVASIKPNPTGRDGPTRTQILPGGRFVATNISLRLLIGQTYRVSDRRLIGGPSWIESAHFDINAKADGELFPSGGVRPLDSAVQALLADRFKLVVHHESRQLPIYALVVRRSDGKLGPNLTSSSRTNCDEVVAAGRGRDGEAPPPGPGQAPPCGARTFPGTLWGDSLPLSFLGGVIAGK